MHKMNPSCAICGSVEKFCQVENGKGPSWCPTKKEKKIIKEALKKYDDMKFSKFAKMASIQEGSCYINRDVKPFVMFPVKSRLEELIEFSNRMGYKKLGLAFCAGLTHEASILSRILEGNGFEVISVCCKVGGVPKERIGLKEEEKVKIGEFDAMCNPIMQAMILNKSKTDFNIMLGLCIGHDSLFLKFIKGLTTVFAVKDRITGHNPLAAIYTSHSYYKRILKKVVK